VAPRRDIRRRRQRAQSGSIRHDRVRRFSAAHCRTSSTLGFLRPRRNSANDHRCMQSQRLDHARCHPTIAAQQPPAAMRPRHSGTSAARSQHPATRGYQIPIGALPQHQAQFGARFRPLEVFRRRPHQTPLVASAQRRPKTFTETDSPQSLCRRLARRSAVYYLPFVCGETEAKLSRHRSATRLASRSQADQQWTSRY